MTQQCASAYCPLQVAIAVWLRWALNYSDTMALHPCQNGLMITFSSAYDQSTWQNTISNVKSGVQTLVSSPYAMMVEVSGLGARSSMTRLSTNLTKTAQHCAETSPPSPCSLQKNLFTYNFNNIDCLSNQLGIPPLWLALSGTSPLSQYPSHPRTKPNTSQPFRNGTIHPHTPSLTSKESTASFSMPLWLRLDWYCCSENDTIILEWLTRSTWLPWYCFPKVDLTAWYCCPKVDLAALVLLSWGQPGCPGITILRSTWLPWYCCPKVNLAALVLLSWGWPSCPSIISLVFAVERLTHLQQF